MYRNRRHKLEDLPDIYSPDNPLCLPRLAAATFTPVDSPFHRIHRPDIEPGIVRSLLRRLAAPSLTFLSVSSIFDSGLPDLQQFAQNSNCATDLRTLKIAHPQTIGEPLIMFLSELRVLEELSIDNTWQKKPIATSLVDALRWPRQFTESLSSDEDSQHNHSPVVTPGGINPNLTRLCLKDLRAPSSHLEAVVRSRTPVGNDSELRGCRTLTHVALRRISHPELAGVLVDLQWLKEMEEQGLVNTV